MDAAHVRVQRPREAHPLDPVERDLARLFAVLDAHAWQYRTYVRVVESRRWRAARRDPPPHLSAAARDRPRPLLPAAGLGRLDARRHRARAARRGRALGGGARRRRGRPDRDHALPPRPRRRRRGRAGADRRARPPGRPTTTSSACASGAARTGRSAWPTTCSGTGFPTSVADELRHESRTFAPFIRFARDPELLREGDEVDGWRVLELPGHADGHICLERDGVLVAGDHVLGVITPTVGLYPESRPDPLADYQASLRRTIELAPRIALPGHGDPDLRPGRARTRDPRAPRAPARPDGRRARPGAAQRLRGLRRALRPGPGRERPPLRPGGDARAPGTARPRGPGRADG